MGKRTSILLVLVLLIEMRRGVGEGRKIDRADCEEKVVRTLRFLFCFDGTVNDSKLMDVSSHYWWFLGRVRDGISVLS